jgi:hypothetical protein
MLLLLLVAILGCSTTKSVVKKITPTKNDLKKQVMIVPLVDQASLGPSRTAQIHEKFVNLLQESSRIVLYQHTQDVRLPKRSKANESSITPSPDLVKKAVDLGMNALIIAVLNPLEVTTGKKGIWPFRDVSSIVELSMVVNVFDIARGCLYMTRLESEKMSFLFDELQGRDENEVIDQILQEKMPPILKRQAAAVIEDLTEEPWIGKILAVENGAVKINAGSNVGIHQGQIFAVYALGESIVCQTGKTFSLLGKKIGEIKTTEIMESCSLAVPLAEARLLAGQIVRFTP